MIEKQEFFFSSFFFLCFSFPVRFHFFFFFLSNRRPLFEVNSVFPSSFICLLFTLSFHPIFDHGMKETKDKERKKDNSLRKRWFMMQLFDAFFF